MNEHDADAGWDDAAARCELIARSVDALARDTHWSGDGIPTVADELADVPAPLLREYLLTALRRLHVARSLRLQVQRELHLRELGETTDEQALHFIAALVDELPDETQTPGSALMLVRGPRP